MEDKGELNAPIEIKKKGMDLQGELNKEISSNV